MSASDDALPGRLTAALEAAGDAAYAWELDGDRLQWFGHLAAAVGAPLVSVFGVTEPGKTRPWGPHARLVGSGGGWPSYDEVRAAVDGVLAS